MQNHLDSVQRPVSSAASPVSQDRKNLAVVSDGSDPVGMADVRPEVGSLLHCVLHQLGEMKAAEIRVLHVAAFTALMDVIIVCQGTSKRHVKAMAEKLVATVKQQGFTVMGTEGTEDCEWILADLCDIVVHIMLPETRMFYRLEDLWDERLKPS